MRLAKISVSGDTNWNTIGCSIASSCGKSRMLGTWPLPAWAWFDPRFDERLHDPRLVLVDRIDKVTEALLAL